MEKEFLDVINSHRGILYKVCNLYVRNREFREDLFQDMVFQLWRSFPSFKGKSQITTWMYRVALNTAISQLRKDTKRPEGLRLSREQLDIPDMASADDPDERLQALQMAIDKLTEIEKALVMLYLEEKSYNQISDILGITPTNVGVKLNRIKSKLENIIKKQNYES